MMGLLLENMWFNKMTKPGFIWKNAMFSDERSFHESSGSALHRLLDIHGNIIHHAVAVFSISSSVSPHVDSLDSASCMCVSTRLHGVIARDLSISVTLHSVCFPSLFLSLNLELLFLSECVKSHSYSVRCNWAQKWRFTETLKWHVFFVCSHVQFLLSWKPPTVVCEQSKKQILY